SSHERTFQDLHLCLAMAMALARGPQGPRGPLHLPSHPVLARTPCRRTGAAGMYLPNGTPSSSSKWSMASRNESKAPQAPLFRNSCRRRGGSAQSAECGEFVCELFSVLIRMEEIGKPVAEALASCSLQDIRSGETVEASKLLTTRSGIFFLTHWGDFNSWEVAQQVRTAIQAKRLDASSICLVGIGSQSSGAKFAEMLELPADVKIYTDARASCYSALCFSRGALPQYSEQLNPYLRVFLMLLGVGSPGTIRTVLGGYIGDRSRPNSATAWIDDALRQGAKKGRWPTAVPDLLGDWKMLELAEVGNGVWDEGFGQEGLRPFELATIRLQNMVGGIIANWSDLAPEDDELLVQQGGVVITKNGKVTYYYRDKGILTYVPMEDAIKALQ
ncbi:unnamed protein product, partial [Durusdinium trenchii]